MMNPGLRKLIDDIRKRNFLKPEYKQLVEALESRDLAESKRLIDLRKINAPCANNGWTLLHLTAEHYIIDSARFLLECGADPNRADETGWLPLHLSIDAEVDGAIQGTLHDKQGSPLVEMTELLLTHGADPNARTQLGRTPLELALKLQHERAVTLMKLGGKKKD